MNNEDKTGKSDKMNLYTKLLKALKFSDEHTKNLAKEAEATFDGAGIYLDFPPSGDAKWADDEEDKG